jgi:hypothetical protein
MDNDINIIIISDATGILFKPQLPAHTPGGPHPVRTAAVMP